MNKNYTKRVAEMKHALVQAQYWRSRYFPQQLVARKYNLK